MIRCRYPFQFSGGGTSYGYFLHAVIPSGEPAMGVVVTDDGEVRCIPLVDIRIEMNQPPIPKDNPNRATRKF